MRHRDDIGGEIQQMYWYRVLKFETCRLVLIQWQNALLWAESNVLGKPKSAASLTVKRNFGLFEKIPLDCSGKKVTVGPVLNPANTVGEDGKNGLAVEQVPPSTKNNQPHWSQC
jgi:hypothetical protein